MSISSVFAPRRAHLAAFTTVLLMVTVGLGASAPAQAMTVGSGKSATEQRNVSEFDAIAVSGSFRVEVRQAAKEAVAVTADDNLLPLIETVVESTSQGRTLYLRTKRGESFRTKGELKIVVDVVKLGAISNSGSGYLLVDTLKTPGLKLSIAGSADAQMRALDTDSLQISIAGSGDVKVAGRAAKLRLSIAGSGDASLTELASDDVTVSIAGSGDAQVTANKSLAATVAGSGDVRYRGTATDLKTTVMGSGSIRKH